jgi:lipid-binding SYLF domain-containing protein
VTATSRAACATLGLVLLAGCASIPGATRQEQLETTSELVKRTLADVERQHPDSQAQVDSAIGIVVMRNKIVKIPLLGGGAGYGVAIDRAKNDTTYLKMSRFDIGAGWGARSVRPVMLFHDGEKFGKYIDGEWDATIGAEASAKVGESGAAGSGSGERAGKDPGYKSYLITDSGVSATASLAVMRVKRAKLKKK